MLSGDVKGNPLTLNESMNALARGDKMSFQIPMDPVHQAGAVIQWKVSPRHPGQVPSALQEALALFETRPRPVRDPAMIANWNTLNGEPMYRALGRNPATPTRKRFENSTMISMEIGRDGRLRILETITAPSKSPLVVQAQVIWEVVENKRVKLNRVEYRAAPGSFSAMDRYSLTLESLEEFKNNLPIEIDEGNFNLISAGVEASATVAQIRQRLTQIFESQEIWSALSTLAESHEVREFNPLDYLSGAKAEVGALQQLGYTLEGKGLYVPGALLPSTAIPTPAVSIYVDPAIDEKGDTRRQLENVKNISLANAVDAADIIVSANDLRTNKAKQILLQVENARSATAVTPALIFSLQEHDLLLQGRIILLYKGDLSEDVVLFA